MLVDLKVKDFIKEVASDSPAPGGGSVAALSAAAGAGLISMLANLTKGKKGYESVWDEMAKIAEHAKSMSEKFLAFIDEDTKAFEVYMDAMRMPKNTDEEKRARSAAMQAAAQGAANVPFNLASEAFKLIEYTDYVIKNGNKNATSDGAVAALMLRSAVLGAIYNVRINLLGIKDEGFTQKMGAAIDKMEQQIKSVEHDILSGVEF